MLEKIKKHKYGIIIIIISLIYFILTSAQSFNPYYYAGYDDYLILHEAKSILDLKWLGHYWSSLLSKGPGAAIFVAIANFTGINLLKAQFLFYLGAVILFAHVLKKVIKSDTLRILIFTVILFNPVIYDAELSRAYRDNINSSFLLYIISCGFGIFFNYRENIKKIVPYMIGLGFFGTWMAITREETIWISPFVIGSAVITILFIVFDKECLDKLKKVLLYLIPISIYLIAIFIICLFNRIAYGNFIRLEQNTKAYKDFIKALSSIDVEEPVLKVDISTEAREKAYEVSPTFAKFKERMEREDGFKMYGDYPNEIENGWFMWAVYDVADNGNMNITGLKKLNKCLTQITSEINQAFEDGRLKKEDNPKSILDKDSLETLFENIDKTFKFQLELQDFRIKNDIDIFKDEENPFILRDRRSEFFEITGENPTSEITYNYKSDEIKINILTKIFNIYKTLSKPLFLAGLVIFSLMILRFFFIKPRFGNYKELIILTSFIMLWFIRVVVIAYVETKLCPGISVGYLSSTYSLQFGFGVLSIIFGIAEVINIWKGITKNARETKKA